MKRNNVVVRKNHLKYVDLILADPFKIRTE